MGSAHNNFFMILLWDKWINRVAINVSFCSLKKPFLLPYASHHNPALITNHYSWILTIHKDRIFWQKLLKNKERVFINGVMNIQAAANIGAMRMYSIGSCTFVEKMFPGKNRVAHFFLLLLERKNFRKLSWNFTTLTTLTLIL